MYAISDSSFRAVEADAPLAHGETRVQSVPPELLWKIDGELMKAERGQRLRATDWTQMADAPLSAAQKSTWALYRQALRDLPSKPGFPDVPWPAPPSLDGAAGGVEPVLIP